MLDLTDRSIALELLRRRHPEWEEFEEVYGRWRWLQDSLEGGDRYRYASYGTDAATLPIRNLIRHKREYPEPREGRGAGLHGIGEIGPNRRASTDDDYELRLVRTPVPTFVGEAIGEHLGKVYGQEVRREGPPDLMAFWENVDGRGNDVDGWMARVVAPLFLVLGQLDLLCDHPAAPADETIQTRADQTRLGLRGCVATYLLPGNVLWWRLLPDGRYAEVLVREHCDDGVTRYRYWDAERSTLLAHDGRHLATTPHRYGRVPINRVLDIPLSRCNNVGLSRYGAIAERQREYYNRDSELILSDTTQAHPLLQGPDDYIKGDGTIPVGPNWLLPKKKTVQGSAVHYEGFSVVEFPKGGAESIRQNKQDLRDEVDRDAKLTKPAGATHKGTVSQSGISKQLDHQGGHKLCGEIARSLANFEMRLAEFALTVLRDGPPSPELLATVKIVYPTTFDLETPEELAEGLGNFQALLAEAGRCPRTETRWLQVYARRNLLGLAQEDYEEIDGEIAAAVEASASERERQAEGLGPMPAGPEAAPVPVMIDAVSNDETNA